MAHLIFVFLFIGLTGCFQLDVGVQSVTADSAGSAQEENQNGNGNPVAPVAPGAPPVTVPVTPPGSGAGVIPPAPVFVTPQNPGMIIDPTPAGAPVSYSFSNLPVSMGTTLSFGGVVFDFSQPVSFGNFVTGSSVYTGEPWIVVPNGVAVTMKISSNTPIGVQVNPLIPTRQGYHSGAPRYDVGLATPADSLSITGGQIQTIIVAKHFPSSAPQVSGTAPYLRYRYVDRQVALTVLNAVPPCGGGCALRPAYSGAPSTKVVWDLRNFDFSKIVTNRPIPQYLPSPEPIYNEMARAFNFDYSFNLSSAYEVLGVQNVPQGYGAQAAGRRAVLAEYAMNLATPFEQRLRYQLYLLQYGADIIHSIMYGEMSFNEGGGHGHGRAAPIAMFGAASGNAVIKDAARFWIRLRPSRDAYVPYPLVDAGSKGFGDVSFIYESPTPVAGQPRILWGYVNQFGNVSSDPFGFIDGGHYNLSSPDPYSAYFATINSGTATLMNWVEANPAMAELVDPRIGEYAHRYATVGTHTLPDPQAASRPHLAQHHGKRIYDSANIFIEPVCQYLQRHSAPTFSDCP
jgi:hypothetical protein